MADKYVDIDTLKYLLYDVHELEKLLKRERFVDHDKESLDMFLDSSKDFADRELFPYFKEMDENPAFHKDGHYILDAANNHLPGYAGLTQGAAELIIHFAKKDLLDKYVPDMLAGNWGGTMCLTEPQAGSSLSDIVTKATPNENGYYNISGQKIFISAGDNQYLDNIVHLVLARVEGAPKGTKGISLFIVPKNRKLDDGSLEPNDVTSVADFQKMGQKGYCTTHLGFGDKEDCRGWLVGEENNGLSCMFVMMNAARIGVGRAASAIASAAYYASLQYANERPQGRKLSSDGKKNVEESQSLIIEHPDVRRMLLLQKAVVEGSMSLVLLAAKYYDIESTAQSKEEKIKYNTLLEMIIPVVKTYPSDAGAYSVNNGLQVLGGYGFCSDFILQQYYRDIRISAIYEGTTGIQSQDLLGRKITMNNGEGLKLLLEEIIKTITKASNYPELKEYCDSLSKKIKLSEKILQTLMPYALKGDFEKYLADASIFMEFFSLVIVGWNWLEIAANSQEALKNGDKKYSEIFYKSKIETMKYFFEYELPKTIGHSEIIMNPSSVTIKKEGEILI